MVVAVLLAFLGLSAWDDTLIGARLAWPHHGSPDLITARLNHGFHASVQVLPSLSLKHIEWNMSPKSVSPSLSLFSSFSADVPFDEPKTYQVHHLA